MEGGGEVRREEPLATLREEVLWERVPLVVGGGKERPLRRKPGK